MCASASAPSTRASRGVNVDCDPTSNLLWCLVVYDVFLLIMLSNKSDKRRKIYSFTRFLSRAVSSTKECFYLDNLEDCFLLSFFYSQHGICLFISRFLCSTCLEKFYRGNCYSCNNCNSCPCLETSVQEARNSKECRHSY